MLRFCNFRYLAAVLVAAALLGVSSSAHAAFSLTISNGTNSVTVNDNNTPAGTNSGSTGSPLDLDPASGQIIYSGMIGVFNVNITTGTSNAPGTVSLAQLSINDISTTTAGFTGTKTLTFTLQDTGFNLPTGANLQLESQVSTTQLPTNTNVTYQSFLNGNGGTQLSLNTVGGTRTSDSVSITTTPFSLKSVTTFTMTGTGSAQTVQYTGLTAVTVPAPAGVVLALTAAPFLGVGCWLRRRRKA